MLPSVFSFRASRWVCFLAVVLLLVVAVLLSPDSTIYRIIEPELKRESDDPATEIDWLAAMEQHGSSNTTKEAVVRQYFEELKCRGSAKCEIMLIGFPCGSLQSSLNNVLKFLGRCAPSASTTLFSSRSPNPQCGNAPIDSVLFDIDDVNENYPHSRYHVIIDGGWWKDDVRRVRALHGLFPLLRRGGFAVLGSIVETRREFVGEATSAQVCNTNERRHPFTTTDFLRNLLDGLHAVPAKRTTLNRFSQPFTNADKLSSDILFWSPVGRLDCLPFMCIVTHSKKLKRSSRLPPLDLLPWEPRGYENATIDDFRQHLSNRPPRPSSVTQGLGRNFFGLTYLTHDDKGVLHHYDIPYTIHLEKWRKDHGRRMLEIGLGCPHAIIGASVYLWEQYLPYFNMSSMEYVENCATAFAQMASETQRGPLGGFRMYSGDQSDPASLRKLLRADGDVSYDLIVDDGGHRMDHQMVSLRELWRTVKPHGGIYVVEDLQTSYMDNYGGSQSRCMASADGASLPHTTVHRLRAIMSSMHVPAKAEHADMWGAERDVWSQGLARMDCHHFICFLVKG